MRCVNLVRCPISLHPMLSNAYGKIPGSLLIVFSMKTFCLDANSARTFCWRSLASFRLWKRKQLLNINQRFEVNERVTKRHWSGFVFAHNILFGCKPLFKIWKAKMKMTYRLLRPSNNVGCNGRQGSQLSSGKITRRIKSVLRLSMTLTLSAHERRA